MVKFADLRAEFVARARGRDISSIGEMVVTNIFDRRMDRRDMPPSRCRFSHWRSIMPT